MNPISLGTRTLNQQHLNFMTRRKLILLNIGWATVAAGIYFTNTGSGQSTDGLGAAAPDSEKAGSFLRSKGKPERTLGGPNGSPSQGLSEVEMALAIKETAQAQESNDLAEYFARMVTPAKRHTTLTIR